MNYDVREIQREQ